MKNQFRKFVVLGLFFGFIINFPVYNAKGVMIENQNFVFDWTYTLEDYFGELHGGSWIDPYNFENIYFKNVRFTFDHMHWVRFKNCTFDNSSIYVDTSYHWRIENCSFFNFETDFAINMTASSLEGKFMEDVLIEKCVFEGKTINHANESRAIFLQYGKNATIQKNIFKGLYRGLEAKYSAGTLITNNSFLWTDSALYLSAESFSIISENFFNCDSAIILEPLISVHYDPELGIYFRTNYSNNNTIYNNLFFNVNLVGGDLKVAANLWYNDTLKRGNWYFDYLIQYPNAEENGDYYTTPYRISENLYDYYPLITYRGYNHTLTTTSSSSTNTTDSTEPFNFFRELLKYAGIGGGILIGGIGIYYLVQFLRKRKKIVKL